MRRLLPLAIGATLALSLAACFSPVALAPAPAALPPAGAAPTLTETLRVSVSPELRAAIDRARREFRNGNLASSLDDYRKIAGAVGLPPEVALEMAEVELASGDAGSARDTLQRLLSSGPGEPLRGRVRLLLGFVDLSLGDAEAVLREIDVDSAPDDLGDLAALWRAEAAVARGDGGLARDELSRPQMRESTNRMLLEQAGRLADRAGDPGLAGQLYARGARLFGWTAERTRLYQAAGAAYARAGDGERAIEQYRTLVESYGWTREGAEAGVELERLGGLTPYHRGLVALAGGHQEEAKTAFAEAAAEGEYAAAATRQLRLMEETDAWRAAASVGTVDAYESFLSRFPKGSYAPEARFQEGMAYYEAERFTRAQARWDEAASMAVGDERARALLWAGKALSHLGRGEEAVARLQDAAGIRPSGYYALRARDLLAGEGAWPRGNGTLKMGGEAETAEAERWIESWAGPPSATPADERRIRRGLGLLALGMRAEASAEFNALAMESRDPRLLFRLAQKLSSEELWSPASRAATQLAALSPAKVITDAPQAVQRLAYPPAYWDLIEPEAKRRGLDPLLLLAMMHQESRYDPLALSVSDARGLTQVIPSTGRGIAKAVGAGAFSPDDLYRPYTAVEFGAWYLANQLSSFGGDPFRGLAAYNAGAGPIPRWVADDPDLFVERIDYSQTRSYVRQIYLHYAIYRSLAGN